MEDSTFTENEDMNSSLTDNGDESINPCPPEWLDNEDNALLRGDAIGDTVYTHRWVLKCLFTITEGMPKYLNGAKALKDQKSDNSSITSEKEDAEQNEGEKIEEGDSLQNESKILELDSEVEDAACQLWDMTVEKDVSIHLLSLEDVDILQLASLIFDESCAPRLTEVMVGVVANFCCEEEGCNRLLKKEEPDTLLSALHLLGSTSDVPTLCELMRLLRLLLWHRINRTPNTLWASCPLLKLLCQEQYRSIFSFLLHNSLSDVLISNVLELLSHFLFICLPETGLNVASLYSSEEIVSGLIEIVERKSQNFQKHLDEDKEKIAHLGITCLYAFIDTPGVPLIQLSASKSESKLESILLAYIEHQGRVESPEELTEEISDKVIRIIGLSQLLIPTMKLPALLLTVGKLLALIYGETLQYSVSRSQSREDEEICCNENNPEPITLLNRKGKHRKRKSVEEVKPNYPKTPVSNPLVEDSGWLSPPAAPLETASVSLNQESVSVEKNVTFTPDVVGKESKLELTNLNKSERKYREKSISVSSLNTSDLKDLKDQLEDYCYQLIAYWWSDSRDMDRKLRRKSQTIIIDVLDQCHAHEVFLILNAVRLRDSNLVPKLQEQILDSGSHQRLVALLAHMYQ